MQARSVTDQDAATPTLVEAGQLAINPGTKPPRRYGFQKGQSGNPSGRPRGSAGLSALIKEQTGDGRELVSFALRMMRSTQQESKYRLQALEWLADRCWGKAVQAHEVTGEGGGPLQVTYVVTFDE